VATLPSLILDGSQWMLAGFPVLGMPDEERAVKYFSLNPFVPNSKNRCPLECAYCVCHQDSDWHQPPDKFSHVNPAPTLLEPLMKSVPYHEIAPHLVMMAFLHRVVNGGGTLEREYAIGTRRMDMCLRYGKTVMAMELKVWRDNRPDPLTAGLEQLEGYLAGLGLSEGWLVIFDRRGGAVPIAERTAVEQAKTQQGRKVWVIRG